MRKISVLTPVMDAKLEIVMKARAAVLVALAFSLAVYGTEVIAGLQAASFPSLGIDPASALLAVSIFSAVIVGLVLADKPTIADHASDGENSTPASSLRAASSRRQASALILADTLVIVSVFTAFIGIGALVRAGQLLCTPTAASSASPAPAAAFSEPVLLAFIVAGIAWVFVLLAAANSKSPAEVKALATFKDELYKFGAQRREIWQLNWMQAGDADARLGAFSDKELKSIQKKTKASMQTIAWSVLGWNLLVFAIVFSLYFFVAAPGTRWGVMDWNRLRGVLIATGFYAFSGAVAYVPLRQAMVKAQIRQRASCGKWLVASVGCILPSTLAAIAIEPWLALTVSSIYVLLGGAAWLLHRKSDLSAISLGIDGDIIVDNGKFGLAGLYFAVGDQLRNFPLPIKPESPAPNARETARALRLPVVASVIFRSRPHGKR